MAKELAVTVTVDQVELAAHTLYELYPPQSNPWLTAIGIGNGEVVIYTKLKRVPKPVRDWTEFGGVPVRFVYSGPVTVGGN